MRKMYNVALRRAFSTSSMTVEDVFTAVREHHSYNYDTIEYYLTDISSIIPEYTTGVIARAINADLRKISRDIIAEERQSGLTVDNIMVKYDLNFDEFRRLANAKAPRIDIKSKISAKLEYKPTLEQCVKRAEELGKSYGIYMSDYYADDVIRGIFKPTKRKKEWWQ